jgi:hypothetical protein
MKEVVSRLYLEYLEFRENQGKRKINKADEPKYSSHLNNIIADLHSAWLGDPDQFIGYNRGRANFREGGSYWDANKGKALLSYTLFINLIDFLCELDYIELVNLLNGNKVTWASIRTDISNSAIVVKDENKNVVPPPEDAGFDLEQAEANLRLINENLQKSLINFNITDEEFEKLRARLSQRGGDEDQANLLESERQPVDFTNRSLKRIFACGSFDNGGRFYGGWWQGLPKEYRKYIEIEGCVTVEMDYSTIQPRILYAKADADPPDDSYTVPDWDNDLRDITKKAFNQLVNSSEDSRNPNQWHRFAPNLDPEPLPEGWDRMDQYQRAGLQRDEFQKRTGREYKELLHDLKNMHEPIDAFFFSQSWTWLQRIDSDIAEKVMLKLLEPGQIPCAALPIHDSFIVRRDAEGRLRRIMSEVFEEVVGVPGNVDRNEALFPPPRVDGGQYEENNQLLAKAADLFDDALEDPNERSGYYRREAEWVAVEGPL